ncbi:MAG: DUF4491 family protein [Porphyromonadaceae bacterium]|nr:DUF4491 family protein [Porphyromonadaceae bacterium]
MLLHLQGVVIGIVTFLIIGIFHPLVIKVEYHWGIRGRWIFLIIGIIGIILSIVILNLIVSALCGIIAFSAFWSVWEVYRQEERVRKGWFPRNPNRRYPWDNDTTKNSN